MRHRRFGVRGGRGGGFGIRRVSRAPWPAGGVEAQPVPDAHFPGTIARPDPTFGWKEGFVIAEVQVENAEGL
jgi:hypothetical protein